ncbi:DUF5928 domain-containing protein [Mesobacterium sp. TK19101]|uniref:Peptide O-xylosyltransferase n=1 Tax=Mesobacterium hydrothermale TaxID=3111907 RepID=A0ABU6HEN1_9RHOB|nr:DUF5928 domain-containing protein [Mesobacterium sp. TK19101]MEC3860928.1 DUF5928 domain-containing protein [Mesobacterium sp. TK19101]
MAKIAFLLLCHKDPDAVIRQAEMLTGAGDFVAIHWDGRAAAAGYDRIRAGLSGNGNVIFTRRRIKCGWGEYSLVQATLEVARVAVDGFPKASHFYLLSGDCMPIKPAEHAHAFLDAGERDYIESFDYFTSGWIKTGMVEERLIYRHFVNERRHKWLFYAMIEAQRRLGLKRALPRGLDMRIGSQWWCLRRQTLEAVLAFIARRRDVARFFRRSWIPDESFFQTLVWHLVPRDQIVARPLTFLVFSDYGMPASFHDDHYDFLLAQDHLFARKISPGAAQLRDRLATLFLSSDTTVSVTGEGRAVHGFLTRQGRSGQRFGPRFWEAAAQIGAGRDLLIVLSRDHGLGRRLVRQVGQVAGIPAYGYLFRDIGVDLPDLGGIETSLVKRHRHRASVLRMIFEHHGSDRLAICMDPDDFTMIRDLVREKSTVRLLSLDLPATPEALRALAIARGLATDQTPGARLAPVLAALKNDLLREAERYRAIDNGCFFCISPQAPEADIAQTLAEFLSVPQDRVQDIVRSRTLFAD